MLVNKRLPNRKKRFKKKKWGRFRVLGTWVNMSEMLLS